MQHFTSKALKAIKERYSKIRSKYIDMTLEIGAFAQKLRSERAKEFMQHGVSRRLWLLYRCVERIYDLFPPDRIEQLEQDDRLDVEICLHAFLINIYGIIENLALALAYENNLIDKAISNKIKINLFNKDFRNLLNPQLRSYLSKNTITQWYAEYAKNYRDALAHRIPPYVPPAALNAEERRQFEDFDKEISLLYQTREFEKISALQEKQLKLGRSNPLVIHSFSEKAIPFYLHPQLLSDFVTIEELLKKAMASFYRDPSSMDN